MAWIDNNDSFGYSAPRKISYPYDSKGIASPECLADILYNEKLLLSCPNIVFLPLIRRYWLTEVSRKENLQMKLPTNNITYEKDTLIIK
jgi:hypothetical protein